MTEGRIRKLLVANRGEISLRVFRACRDLGIATVAVYSEADAGSLHVREADEAYEIGGTPASESYLNIPNIVAAIEESGADAVHPGYGFLSESATFARAVEEAGAIWVGPSPKAMESVGLKVRAKELADRARVPTVPGYDGSDQSEERLSEEAELIGYPVLVKASAGGGGRGMREVHDAKDFLEAVRSAKSEAESSFSDGTVFIEKLVERPRHIEVQIIADTHGNVVHLFERECSIQRRHQKVIEEAPSPALSPERRAEVCEAAVSLAREVGYTNAGTVEFLFSEEGEFYFLEMNARLQVEHPVTEEVTGLDLVKLQLAVASGEELSVSQDDITLNGAAIEARIYTEDERGFPDGGRLMAFDPPAGRGIRNDSGVRTGDTVSLAYDSMISKLIVHALGRDRAVSRLSDALSRYTIIGPSTNLALLRLIVATEAFVEGETATDFLARHGLTSESGSEGRVPVRALAAAAVADTSLVRAASDPFEIGPWRALGRARVSYEDGEGHTRLEVTRAGSEFTVSTDSESLRAEALATAGNVVYVVVDGEDSRVEVREDSLRVESGGETYEIFRQVPPTLSDADASLSGAGLKAPMPGTITKVMVEEGQEVEEGQTLLVLEAMKMEYPVVAPSSGTVRELPFSVGELVSGGATLLELEVSEEHAES